MDLLGSATEESAQAARRIAVTIAPATRRQALDIKVRLQRGAWPSMP